MYKREKKPVLAAVLFLAAALLLGGCTVRTVPLEAPPVGEPAVSEAEPAVTETLYTVRFVADGETIGEEQLPAGAFPTLPTLPEGDAAFLGWLDGSGNAAAPETIAVAGDVTYTAAFAPALHHDRTFITAESGIFRPDEAMTRQEAAEMLFALMAEPPAIPAELPTEPAFDEGKVPKGALSLREEDEAAAENKTPEAAGAVVEYNEELQSAADHIEASTPRQAEAYGHLAALCQAGYMTPYEDGSLRPREFLDRAGFEQLLRSFFPAETLSAAMETEEGDPLTRLQIARIMNTLLDREPAVAADTFYADIPAGDARLSDIRAACENGEKREPGYLILSNGALYWIGEDGYILRDTDVGRMHFGPDGRHTSGSEELDVMVREIVANVVDPAAEHEEQLRSVYNYVRDNFVYLRRNYYAVGEKGWELEEATYFLDTHYGNCYTFAAGMWALARGVGYDANAISGLTGEQNAQHGWIDIEMEDGVRYFFDVELEYAALRDGATLYPMFKLPWSGATVNWNYTYNWTVEGFPIY
ncbi:MAG: S-layer homology domain-containing protein [Oscillospiraceae bacterium]|nr:S-layer homology domain-containing protein [Oscillospiraceae bacterium]